MLPSGLLYFAQVAHWMSQCTIYAQDLRKILSQCTNMHKIRARFTYFSNVQDLHKIVLISPMLNICARFVQDCTYFPNAQYMLKIYARFDQDCTYFSNAQYMHKIAGIIRRNMSHITYLL